MNGLHHETYLEDMSAALDGELSPERRQALEAHLARCPQCAALFDTLSRQSQALRELDCTPPQGLEEKILSNLPARRVIHWRRWGALAACLALTAVLAGSILLPGQDTPAPQTRQGNSPQVALYTAPALPGGDQVLTLNEPTPALLSLLPTEEAVALEDGSCYCLVSQETLELLLSVLEEEALPYTLSPASAPDGSGEIAVVWQE